MPVRELARNSRIPDVTVTPIISLRTRNVPISVAMSKVTRDFANFLLDRTVFF